MSHLFNPYDVNFKPQEVVQDLDKYIVGQQHLKKSLALAVYKHFNRLKQRDRDGKVTTRIKKPNGTVLNEPTTWVTTVERLCNETPHHRHSTSRFAIMLYL